MNPVFIVTMTAIVAIFYFVFKGTKRTINVSNINVDEFKTKIGGDDVVVLDVRTNAEINHGMIHGATNISVTSTNFLNQILKLDRSKTYLVYCRSGRRSGKACQIMYNNGFQKVYNLQGGYIAWTNHDREA